MCCGGILYNMYTNDDIGFICVCYKITIDRILEVITNELTEI